jgi:hypothetical protein
VISKKELKKYQRVHIACPSSDSLGCGSSSFIKLGCLLGCIGQFLLAWMHWPIFLIGLVVHNELWQYLSRLSYLTSFTIIACSQNGSPRTRETVAESTDNLKMNGGAARRWCLLR